MDRNEIPEPDSVLTGNLWGLLQAMKRVLDQLPEEERHHEVQRERLTVHDRMVYLMDLLSGAGERAALLFEDLVRDVPLTRQRVVLTFLAILELAKIQALVVFQNSDAQGVPTGPVRIRAAVGMEPGVAIAEPEE